MEDFNDNRRSRKKLVDLKAVAALLDDNDDHAPSDIRKNQAVGFIPNEDLIQETARIKSQRDLIQERIKKMEQGRSQVAKNVFDKVSRDYSMQLRAITELLNEKKTLLNKELKNLYTLREKQTVEISRHKEILEEAKFRHYLGEFSEDQYKEVEEYESREIGHLQSEFSKIHSFVKVHEELFDPTDLGFTPQNNSAANIEPEVTKTVTPAMAQALKTPAPVTAPKATLTPSDLSEKTPLPIIPDPLTVEKEKIVPLSSEATHNNIEVNANNEEGSNYLLPSEPSYFNESNDNEVKTAPAPQESSYKTQLNVETSSSTSSSPKLKQEPESIFDILEDISLDSDPLNIPEKALNKPLEAGEPSATPLGTKNPTATTALDEYKIVFTAGDVGMKEIGLKDNIAIGRSPSNDVTLNSPKVSRQHAAINKYKDRYILIDLKSSNGVFVNGRKIDEHTLMDGDEISVGDFKMVFQKA